MSIVLFVHSWLRWLIVIVAVVAIVKFAVGLSRRGAFDPMSRGLQSGFTGLLDLQALLGVIYFFWSGLTGTGFPGFRIEHAIAMVVALAVAHIASARGKNAPDPQRYRTALLGVAAALVILFVGIVLLPGGPSRLIATR